MSAPHDPSPPWRGVSVCALLLAAWHERGLLATWNSAPYDNGGFPAFLIWCAVVLCVLGGRPWRPQSIPVALAMMVASFGAILEVHLLVQIGAVGVVVMQVKPHCLTTLLMSVSAIAWMPGFGWAMAGFFEPGWAPFLRIVPVSLVLPIAYILRSGIAASESPETENPTA